MFAHGRILVLLGLLSCAACTGTASPFIAPTATPMPSPTPTPAPGAIKLTPSALSFTSAGTAAAQTVGVSEANYSGAFTSSTTTCSGIATIAPGAGSSLVVTPVAAGHCTFSIAGGAASATLTIDVTTTTVGGS